MQVLEIITAQPNGGTIPPLIRTTNRMRQVITAILGSPRASLERTYLPNMELGTKVSRHLLAPMQPRRPSTADQIPLRQQSPKLVPLLVRKPRLILVLPAQRQQRPQAPATQTQA